MTTKTALKKIAAKNGTPLLDAAKLANPHKPEWSKEAAAALEAELKTMLETTPALSQATLLRYLREYGPVAGWKNVAKLIVKHPAAQ